MSWEWMTYRMLAPVLGAAAPAVRPFAPAPERVLWSERLGRLGPEHHAHAWIHAASLGEALDDLPEYVQLRLENVAVVVEEAPTAERLARLGFGPGETLLGLYEGINRLDRSAGYHLVLPDRITLFRQPIIDEVGSSDPAAIREEIRRTVIHEVAHHFGIDDAELEQLERGSR